MKIIKKRLTPAKSQPAAKQRISDEALVAKTGKTMEQWFSILDKIDATSLSHTEMAAYLCKKYGEEKGWHFQMITNSYEVARGLREKHQKPKGYEISVSKVINAPAQKLFVALSDEKKRKSWLGEHSFTIRTQTKNKSIRALWDDQTTLSIDFYDKGASKAQIIVQHAKLNDAQKAEAMKRFWKEKLELLKKKLEAA